jgi:hypothetical protein
MGAFIYGDPDQKQFTCPSCNWAGKGSELFKIEFHKASFIQDLGCPSCYEYLGFTAIPAKEEAVAGSLQQTH